MSNDDRPMHPEFAKWYREVNVDDNRDRLQRRWIGVSSLAGDATILDVESILNIVFHTRRTHSPETLGRIRQPFKNADDLFDSSGNDRELEILCGAVLAVLLERNDDIAGHAGLAISTTSLAGVRVPDLPMNLSTQAQDATARMSEVSRRRPEINLDLSSIPSVSFIDAKKKIEEQFDATGVTAALDIEATAINGALETIAKLVSTVGKKNDTFTAIQDEELNLLWWVIGQRSDDLNQTFQQVPSKAQPLVFAKELATLTKFLPGPLSIKSLLSRAGLSDNTSVTIPETINACETPWLSSFAAGSDFSSVVQPIHFAIQRKLETGDQTSWVAGWARACAVDEQNAFSPLTLGWLFYCERLLSIFN